MNAALVQEGLLIWPESDGLGIGQERNAAGYNGRGLRSGSLIFACVRGKDKESLWFLVQPVYGRRVQGLKVLMRGIDARWIAVKKP